MPYKAQGRLVMVKRAGKWHVHRTADSAEKARSEARALNANVPGYNAKKGGKK
jgi:hypothetical protein